MNGASKSDYVDTNSRALVHEIRHVKHFQRVVHYGFLIYWWFTNFMLNNTCNALEYFLIIFQTSKGNYIIAHYCYTVYSYHLTQ